MNIRYLEYITFLFSLHIASIFLDVKSEKVYILHTRIIIGRRMWCEILEVWTITSVIWITEFLDSVHRQNPLESITSVPLYGFTPTRG
jgi:hypothetical protein